LLYIPLLPVEGPGEMAHSGLLWFESRELRSVNEQDLGWSLADITYLIEDGQSLILQGNEKNAAALFVTPTERSGV
jgi:hypothetical protein